MKVGKRSYHFNAQCMDCDWEGDATSDPVLIYHLLPKLREHLAWRPSHRPVIMLREDFYPEGRGPGRTQN